MKRKRMLFVIALSAFWGLACSAAGEAESMIGAEVVGVGGYSSLGKVVGVARGGPGGSALMYVVAEKGIFGGRGVIPFSHVRDEVKVPRKDGGFSYRVEVDLNKATFRNIAKWRYREEPLSAYFSRMESILGVIYGLEESTLDSLARDLVVDFGEERYSEPGVAER